MLILWPDDLPDGEADLQIAFEHDPGVADMWFGIHFDDDYLKLGEIALFVSLAVRMLVNFKDPKDVAKQDEIRFALASPPEIIGINSNIFQWRSREAGGDYLGRVTLHDSRLAPVRQGFASNHSLHPAVIGCDWISGNPQLLAKWREYSRNQSNPTVAVIGVLLDITGFGILHRKAVNYACPAIRHLYACLTAMQSDDGPYLEKLHSAARATANLHYHRPTALIDQHFISADLALTSYFGS